MRFCKQACGSYLFCNPNPNPNPNPNLNPNPNPNPNQVDGGVDAALDVLNNLARQHQQQLEAAGDPRQGHSAGADLSPGAVQWLERSDGSEQAVRVQDNIPLVY